MKTTIQPKINFPDQCDSADSSISTAYQNIVTSIGNIMTILSQLNESSDLAQVSFINLCAVDQLREPTESKMYIELVFDYDHHGSADYVENYIESAKVLVTSLNTAMNDLLTQLGFGQFEWVQQEGTRAYLI